MKYSNGEYDIKHTRYPNRRRYRVQLRADPDYHTHIRTLKEAIDLANFAKYHKIPKSASYDYLESLLRLSKDRSFRSSIIKVMNSKEGK